MANESAVVDINSASVKDLETLFGVGRAKAEAIFNTRMVKRAFNSLEELLEVPGIGRNVLDQNKGTLVCNIDNTVDGRSSLPDDDEDNSGLRVLSAAAELSDLSSSIPHKSAPSSRRSTRRASSANTGTTPTSSGHNLTPSSSQRSSPVNPSCTGASKRTSPTYRTSHTSSSSSVLPTPSSSSSTLRTRQRLDYNSVNLGINHSVYDIVAGVSRKQEEVEDVQMELVYMSDSNADQEIEPLHLLDPNSSDFKNILNVSGKKKASSKGFFIGDEVGEAELNRLRVRENNYGDDNCLSSQRNSEPDDERMQEETSEELAEVIRRTGAASSLVSAAVLGSDTPYEEPSEAHGIEPARYSPNTVEQDRLRGAVNSLPSSETLMASHGRRRRDTDVDGGGASSSKNSNFKTTSNSSYNFSNSSINIGNSNKGCANTGDLKCTLSNIMGTGPGEVCPCESHYDKELLEDDSDEQDSDTDEDDEGEDVDVDLIEDEDMVVDVPPAINDKKQVKRKFEVGGGELRTLVPVKKSCKAEESCLSSPTIRRQPATPTGLPSWLGQFSGWTQQEKLSALDALIGVCDLNQVRHVHQIILPTFQRDFISLLPKELALYVLSFLSPKDLLKAAQTCKYWNMLTADNLLWREKCKEAGIDNFLDHMDKRRRKGTSADSISPFKTIFMQRHLIECNWRINPLKSPNILKGHDDHVITCLQFSGNTIVSGSDDNTLKVWNATTGKCMRTLTGHTGGVWSSQMKDNIIVSGSTDRMLRVWDAETGECTQTLYGHTSTVRCLHLHNNIVVSGSRDATLRVWDVTTGICNHVLVGHVAAVRCVQYNGRLVVSGAYDFMVKVWNPEREECLHTLQGHTNRVYSLQFDGVHVVSGSLDTTIRVWDVESGTCRHTLMGHQSLTSGMELHNNILISGNADSTVKVWDIVTGQCLQTLSGPHKHRSAVTCLQFINKFVVTSSDDGTVKLWDVSTGEFVRNLVTLDTGNSGGVVWRIRASDTKLVCAVGSRNGTEETKLLVLDFGVEEQMLISSSS